jgi:uncharacterized membrane protein YgcG
MLRKAVYGMLPKNNLREERMRKLRIFPGPEHPFKGVELVPWAMPDRRLQDRRLGWLPPHGFEPMNPAAYAQRMRGSRLLQPAAAEQQQQQQQLGSSSIAEAAVPLVGSAGSSSSSSSSSSSAAPLSFEDLLTAEELVFVRGGSGSSSGGGSGSDSGSQAS